MSNILILGGCGFIGESILKKINDLTLNITVLDKRKKQWSKSHSNSKIKFINCDIKNIEKYVHVLKKADIIIDCIGRTQHNFESEKNLKKDIDENFLNKIGMLLYLSSIKRKINYISLGTLYKYGNIKSIESNIKKNKFKNYDFQAINKSAYEQYLAVVQQNNKYLRVLVINFGSVYGFNKNKDISAVNSLIIDFIKKKKIYYYQNINGKRLKNIIFIDDLVKIIVRELIKFLDRGKNIKSFREINITKNLVDMNQVIKFISKNFPSKNIKYIKNTSMPLYYYYLKEPKITNSYKKSLLKTIQCYKKKFND